MIQHIGQLYEPKLFDGLKPVSQKTHENARLENKLHSAKALIMITELAEKVGVELTADEELTRQAINLVKIDEQHNTFDRAVLRYEKREADYQQGKMTEKVQRFFGGNPVDPRVQGQQTPAQPQFVVVNQDDTLRKQVEQLAGTVQSLTQAFEFASQPATPQAQPQPLQAVPQYENPSHYQPTPQATDGNINWSI